MESFRYSNGEVKIAVVAPLLVLCGCGKVRDYPVPAQHPAPEAVSVPAARVLNMDDPGVTRHFVRDISPDLTSNWRWGFQKPAVRIRVRGVVPLKYFIDLALPEITFKDTGPVTIAFTVNDNVLDRVRYTAAGNYHFERPVPADWLYVGNDAIVGAEIDKMWVSQIDGARFGFIITRIGLTE